MKVCKHYDKKDGTCQGYHASGRLGGWVERSPGVECVFKGAPPEEEKHNKWCLGYEPEKKGEHVGKKTFDKKFMQNIVYEEWEKDGDIELVYNKIVECTRWSIIHEVVFKYYGVFYMTSYSEGATELQDESPYEYDDKIECTIVVPVEKKVIMYEPQVNPDEKGEKDGNTN